jgi:hypothetical protein
VNAGLAARHTASKILKELIDKQVLVEVTATQQTQYDQAIKKPLLYF